jgi:hypothetical protein
VAFSRRFPVTPPSKPSWQFGLESTTDNAANRQIMVNFPDKVLVEFSEGTSLKAAVAMHHIHIYTPNVGTLRDVNTLGARSGVHRNFQAAFSPGGEVDFQNAPAPPALTKGRALDHIGFEVKNLGVFATKLEKSGIKLEAPVRDVPRSASRSPSWSTPKEPASN